MRNVHALVTALAFCTIVALVSALPVYGADKPPAAVNHKKQSSSSRLSTEETHARSSLTPPTDKNSRGCADCTPAADPEDETCAVGTRENDGCNMETPVFDHSFESSDSVCGEAWTLSDGSHRDTDWFELVLTEPTLVQLKIRAEFPAITGLIEMTVPGSGNCADMTGWVNPYILLNPCVNGGTWANLQPGTHWFFVAPQSGEILPSCLPYVAHLESWPGTAYDTISTELLSLAVGSNGSSGGYSEGLVNMDFVTNGGDCDTNATIYLYNGGPIVGWGWQDMYWSAAGIHANNEHGLVPIGDPEKQDFGGYEQYTAEFQTPDSNSSMTLVKTWYAPKTSSGASGRFIVQRLKLTNNSGESRSIVLGEAVDWDIPSVPDFVNTAVIITGAGGNYVCQQGTGSGCNPNTQRYGGVAYVMGNYSFGGEITSPHNTVTLSNQEYIFDQGDNYDPDMLLSAMLDNSGQVLEATGEDIHTLMSFDSLGVLGDGQSTEHVIVLATSKTGSTDLANALDEGKAWALQNICLGIRGNANGDPANQVNVADLNHLVNSLRMNTLPTNPEEGDVNGDGWVNVSDARDLAIYAILVGPPPVACSDSTSQGGGSGGNVQVHLNGGDDVAYIGQTNILEIWIENPAALEGFSLALELQASTAYTFNGSYGGGTEDYVLFDACMNSFDGVREALPAIDNISLDTILIWGFALTSSGLAASGSQRCFTMEFDIPSGEAPAVNGFVVRPIAWLPTGTWTFHDAAGSSAPDFQRMPTVFEYDPGSANAVATFNIQSDDPFESFEVVANGSGPLTTPLPAALASNGFPTPGNADPGDDQQVGSGKWAFHTTDNGGSSGGGTFGSYGAFLTRVMRGDNAQDIGEYDFEMRFNYISPGIGGSVACRAYGDNSEMWVPFELWRIGRCTPDDPSDDIRMTPLILDWDDMGDYTLENWGTSSSGGGAWEHSGSPGDNDPYCQPIYWMMPTDTTPGQSGYFADVAVILAGTYAFDGEEVLARTVLINVDAGTSPPFGQNYPESGTVIRIRTTKSEPCGCCIPPIRGDVDYAEPFAIDIADLVYLVDFMFTGGPPPICLEEADMEVNGEIDISDLVFLVDYMFNQGPPPPPCS